MGRGQRRGREPSRREWDDFVSGTNEQLTQSALTLCRFSAIGVEYAEDIRNEAYLRVLGKWAKVSNHSNPVGYLFVTMQNVFREYCRSLQGAVVADEVVAAALLDSRSAEDAFLLHDTALRVLDAVQHLSEGESTVIVMRLNGFSGPEIAEALGIEQDAVRARLSRATRYLRDVARQTGRGSGS